MGGTLLFSGLFPFLAKNPHKSKPFIVCQPTFFGVGIITLFILTIHSQALFSKSLFFAIKYYENSCSTWR